jgi:HTH-type transcriptional repressor of NAD biosynthesis genes
VDRAAFQRQVLGDLGARKVPFNTLRGTLEERVTRVRELLSRFNKYAKVLEVLGDARER